MNTRILHIFGPENADKYFQDSVENGKISKEELWEESWLSKVPMWYEDNSFQYEAYKFGDVDPTFIDFVKRNFVNDTVYPSNFHTVGNE